MSSFQPLLFNGHVRRKEQADARGEVIHVGNGGGAARLEAMCHCLGADLGVLCVSLAIISRSLIKSTAVLYKSEGE